MDKFEDLVGGVIFATSFPPTLDDPFIVAIDFVAWLGVTARKYGLSKEVEAESFSPSDIPSFVFPTWEESPCSPALADDDANACFRAGI
jgi:hypothetical protein